MESLPWGLPNWHFNSILVPSRYILGYESGGNGEKIGLY